MVAGRVGHRPATRPQGEERLAECPPNTGRRDTRAAASTARTRAVRGRGALTTWGFRLWTTAQADARRHSRRKFGAIRLLHGLMLYAPAAGGLVYVSLNRVLNLTL